MPSSVIIPAVIGGAASAGAAAVVAGSMAAFTMTAFAQGFITSAILGGLSAALAPSRSSEQQSSITNGSRTVTIRQAISPWRIIYGQTRVGGVITYKKVTDGDTHYHMIITLAGHVCEEIGDIYFGNEVVQLDGSGNATGRYAGYFRVKKSLGDEAGQPFSDLVTESGGEWTDAHRQTECTKIYVRVIGNAELFPQGIQNITAVVKGNKVYDPRTGLTVWSENDALCANHYLTNTRFGLGAVYADEINATVLTASANICDEAVSLAAGGTESRYTCNGEFLTSERPADIITKIAAAMAGHVVQIGAKWNIHAGAYETPTLEFDESSLIAGLEWQSLVSRRDSCNCVKGVYVDPANLWQPTDFPAIVSSTYIAEDNDEPVYRDLELPLTNSGTMAQRIAKIELLRTRQGQTVKWPGNLSCFRAQPGRTITLTFAQNGWSAKPFYVTGGEFSINADGTLGYTIFGRETAAAVYDWSTSEEQTVDFAPNTDLGDPFTVAAPSSLTLTQSTTVPDRGTVSWVASTGNFVVAYRVEYKRSTESAYRVLPDVAVPATSLDIDGLLPTVYDLRIRAVNAFECKSDYIQTQFTVVAVEPPRVSGLEIFGLGNATEFTGKDCKFAWRRGATNTSYDIGSEPYGANSGAPDYFFKDFEVRIYSTAGALLRTEHVYDPIYTYTLEKNLEDAAVQGEAAGYAYRSFEIRVWQRGRYNQTSALPAVLTVSNPAPAVPTVRSTTARYNGFILDLERSIDADWSGTRIWVSTSNGFTPDASNLVYDGADVLVNIRSLSANTVYYYRYAFIDGFGEGSRSAQQTITTARASYGGGSSADDLELSFSGVTNAISIPSTTVPGYTGSVTLSVSAVSDMAFTVPCPKNVVAFGYDNVAQITGTITDIDTSYLLGTGTDFQTELQVGDILTLASEGGYGYPIVQVTSIHETAQQVFIDYLSGTINPAQWPETVTCYRYRTTAVGLDVNSGTYGGGKIAASPDASLVPSQVSTTVPLSDVFSGASADFSDFAFWYVATVGELNFRYTASASEKIYSRSATYSLTFGAS